MAPTIMRMIVTITSIMRAKVVNLTELCKLTISNTFLGYLFLVAAAGYPREVLLMKISSCFIEDIIRPLLGYGFRNLWECSGTVLAT